MQSLETFYTTDSFMYLSRMNVTDKCTQYYWTVVAILWEIVHNQNQLKETTHFYYKQV